MSLCVINNYFALKTGNYLLGYFNFMTLHIFILNSFKCFRHSFVAGHRPQKRLFTPEIKRYLKDWLVRRRDNPYPNREEKKYLSRETGLTYIQVSLYYFLYGMIFLLDFGVSGVMFVSTNNLSG